MHNAHAATAADSRAPGNRKQNAAFHVVVLTQARVHPPARAYLAENGAEGKSK
jgi:hypothetical protein